MPLDLTQIPRRRWLRTSLAAVAGAVGLTRLATAGAADEPATRPVPATSFQAWLEGIDGRFKQVYDMPEINHAYGLVWSHVFLLTGAEGYALPESALTAVVVLRHNATPLALNDDIWARYKLGEIYKEEDPATKAPALRNHFFNAKQGDLMIPEASIDKLLARGVKIAVCNMALTRRSGMVAKALGRDPKEVHAEWVAGILPGIHLAPSGVVAINGAQSKGASYCFAG